MFSLFSVHSERTIYISSHISERVKSELRLSVFWRGGGASASFVREYIRQVIIAGNSSDTPLVEPLGTSKGKCDQTVILSHRIITPSEKHWHWYDLNRGGGALLMYWWLDKVFGWEMVMVMAATTVVMVVLQSTEYRVVYSREITYQHVWAIQINRVNHCDELGCLLEYWLAR